MECFFFFFWKLLGIDKMRLIEKKCFLHFSSYIMIYYYEMKTILQKFEPTTVRNHAELGLVTQSFFEWRKFRLRIDLTVLSTREVILTSLDEVPTLIIECNSFYNVIFSISLSSVIYLFLSFFLFTAVWEIPLC